MQALFGGCYNSNMPRPREFDRDAAIDRAMRLFWAHGYAHTSLRALLKEMRIGEGSFYSLFSGKKELYLRCLDRYIRLVTRRRLAILGSTPSIREALPRFFDTILKEIGDRKNPPACLAANSLSDDVLEDSQLRVTIQTEMRKAEAYLRKRLRAAVKTGELRRDFPVQTTAALLFTFLLGLFRVYETIHNRALAKREIAQFLKGLDLAKT